MFIRFDSGELSSPVKTADGRLIVDAKLTRTGVFEYRDSQGGIRKEFRPESEVFKKDSLATFPLASVTNNHPTEMVSIANAKGLTVGMVTDVRRVDDYVAGRLIIFDEDTIKDVESGKLEISCGYHADVEHREGETDSGERYDAVQSNIIINHVAIVDVGRAGPEARIRMDGASQITETKEEEKVDMDLVEALKRVAALEIEKATETARADRAESKVDSIQAELDVKTENEQNESKRLDAIEADVQNRISEEVQIRTKVLTVLPEFKFDGKSKRQAQTEVIKEVCGVELTEERSDEYVQARFDLALELKEESDKTVAIVRSTEIKNDENDEDVARKAMMARLSNAYKGNA